MLQSYLSYSDEELLEMLKSGSETAFKEIFNRYWKKLYAVAYNRLQSKQAAEDVVQDVLSTLWIRREKAEINSLPNYLSAAVRYGVFHAMRKELRNGTLHTELHEGGVAATEEALKYKLIEEAVKKEIDKLPEKCKLVFTYSRELGMGNNEIAEQLGLSPKTVEAHISRALRQLRTALKSSLSSLFSVFF